MNNKGSIIIVKWAAVFVTLSLGLSLSGCDSLAPMPQTGVDSPSGGQHAVHFIAPANYYWTSVKVDQNTQGYIQLWQARPAEQASQDSRRSQNSQNSQLGGQAHRLAPAATADTAQGMYVSFVLGLHEPL